jgi:hypothetical protein
MKGDLCKEYLNLNIFLVYIISVKCSVRLNSNEFKNFICL